MSWCTSSPGSSCRGWEGSEWWAWVSQGYSDEGRDNVWDGVVWEGAVSVLQGNENKSKIWKQCLPVRNEVSWTEALTCKVLIWNIFCSICKNAIMTAVGKDDVLDISLVKLCLARSSNKRKCKTAAGKKVSRKEILGKMNKGEDRWVLSKIILVWRRIITMLVCFRCKISGVTDDRFVKKQHWRRW